MLNNKQSIQKWAIWLGVIGTPLKWIGAVIVLLLLVFAEIRGLQHRLREGRPWYDLSPPSYNTPISNSVPKELS
ncbi:MAG: hypothetical protein N2053_12745 [Chitinispirillaceae bacterium]|nr:hypothetical protein [Chitinispirillaceae bacterium]